MSGRTILGLLAGPALVGAFALGAWCQDQRVHVAYANEGRRDAYYDIDADAGLAYLTCLKDPPGCDRQLATYYAVRAMTEPRLRKLETPTKDHTHG